MVSVLDRVEKWERDRENGEDINFNEQGRNRKHLAAYVDVEFFPIMFCIERFSTHLISFQLYKGDYEDRKEYQRKHNADQYAKNRRDLHQHSTRWCWKFWNY